MSAHISIRGQTYAQIKKHCEENGLHISEFVVGLCERFLAGAMKPAAKPVQVVAKPAKLQKTEPPDVERRPPDLSKTRF